MVRAEADEVGQVGAAAVDPVLDVVQVGPDAPPGKARPSAHVKPHALARTGLGPITSSLQRGHLARLLTQEQVCMKSRMLQVNDGGRKLRSCESHTGRGIMSKHS